jgi:hypothetical protein
VNHNPGSPLSALSGAKVAAPRRHRLPAYRRGMASRHGRGQPNSHRALTRSAQSHTPTRDQGTMSIIVFSPVTGDRYDMTCVSEHPAYCTGGDDAESSSYERRCGES